MALEALKRPKTESVNQSSEWQRKALATLSDDEYEGWEERAAIMEYDGCMPKDAAERLALECVLKRKVTS